MPNRGLANLIWPGVDMAWSRVPIASNRLIENVGIITTSVSCILTPYILSIGCPGDPGSQPPGWWCQPTLIRTEHEIQRSRGKGTLDPAGFTATLCRRKKLFLVLQWTNSIRRIECQVTWHRMKIIAFGICNTYSIVNTTPMNNTITSRRPPGPVAPRSCPPMQM